MSTTTGHVIATFLKSGELGDTYSDGLGTGTVMIRTTRGPKERFDVTVRGVARYDMCQIGSHAACPFTTTGWYPIKFSVIYKLRSNPVEEQDAIFVTSNEINESLELIREVA